MRCSRRQVLVGFFGLVGGGAVAARFALGRAAPLPPARPALPFPPQQTKALHAAIEHALPGALEAGVPDHIAWWLANDRYFGNFARELGEGAHQLDKVARELGGKAFAELSSEQKDEVFGRFQSGAVRAPGFEGARFFEHLVTFTLEGFLADPKYGGNRGQVGWKFIGFKPCWWSPRSTHGSGHEHAGH